VPASPWARIKEHKVLQWSLAYLGTALALAHGQELLAHIYHWPEFVGRLSMGLLIVGFPIAAALAWYHGHKGFTRFSAAEATVISLLLVIGAGLLIVLVRPSTERISTPAANSVASTGAPRTSVAVVPFLNLTGDPSKEYFSDGMAEELIDALTQVPGLRVPARTSSFAYKGRNVDIRRIAQDLGVGTVLEGSVRSAGERIRVTAELVDAQSGYHLWSHSYERQFIDIFKLQDELAGAIIQALRGTVSGAVLPAAARTAPTQDLEAYQLYLQARAFMLGSEEDLHQSIGLFDQALARDPRFARALAGRSEARTVAFMLGYSIPNAVRDSVSDAQQALSLEPNLPEALGALGLTNAVQGHWIEAELNFRGALGSGTSDPRARSRYAIYVLQPAGRLHQAYAEANEAYRLAPADVIVLFIRGDAAAYVESYGEAVRFVNLAISLGLSKKLNTAGQILARAAVGTGHYEEAAGYVATGLTEQQRAAGAVDVLRLGYSARGDPTRAAAARQALQAFVNRLESEELDPALRRLLITQLAALGALDSAYQQANQSIDVYARSGTVGFWNVLWVPEMRAFRKDPRFQAFVTRLRLFDYWKQYGPPDDCDLAGERLVCR
jgi:TolB-like protein